MNAFGIAVLTKERQGGVFSSGRNYVGCQIEMQGRPETITLHIRAKGNGVTPIAVYEAQAPEYPGDLNFTLDVPVTWKDQIPHTRLEERDFMNVIMIDGTLRFVDVQISLLSRRGQFYIVAQRVFEGWTRMAANGEIQFIPGDPVFAYPGANYQAIYRGRSGILATMTRIVDEVLQKMGAGDLDEVTASTWKPQEVPELKGWQTGHTLFFCPITNTGRILGADGVFYHIWGNNLVDVKGPVHMLDPMAPVYFRPGIQNQGQTFMPVRSCKPA